MACDSQKCTATRVQLGAGIGHGGCSGIGPTARFAKSVTPVDADSTSTNAGPGHSPTKRQSCGGSDRSAENQGHETSRPDCRDPQALLRLAHVHASVIAFFGRTGTASTLTIQGHGTFAQALLQLNAHFALSADFRRHSTAKLVMIWLTPMPHSRGVPEKCRTRGMPNDSDATCRCTMLTGSGNPG
jgi:hypothetical protein